MRVDLVLVFVLLNIAITAVADTRVRLIAVAVSTSGVACGTNIVVRIVDGTRASVALIAGSWTICSRARNLAPKHARCLECRHDEDKHGDADTVDREAQRRSIQVGNMPPLVARHRHICKEVSLASNRVAARDHLCNRGDQRGVERKEREDHGRDEARHHIEWFKVCLLVVRGHRTAQDG